MKLSYNSFTNYGRDVESTVRKFPLRSRRGEIYGMRHIIVVTGEVPGADQAEITTRIAAFETAFVDGYDLNLFLDDGSTPSAHLLDQSESASGVQVDGYEWGDTTSVEYLMWRSFTVTLHADYDLETVPTYLEYEDSITSTGNGGTNTVWDEVISGNPVSHQTATNTLRRATQQGRAIGLNAYPSAATPIGTPIPKTRELTKFGPIVEGGRLTNYGIAWRYEYAGNVDYAAYDPTYAGP